MIAGTSPPPSRVLVVAAFAAIYLIWGSTYLAIRFAIETLPPLMMAGVRFMVAGAVLYAWARSRGSRPPHRTHWRSALIVGGLLLLGGGGAVNWAEQYVPSSVTVLLITTVPIWMVLLHWFQRDGARPTVAEGAGVLLGFLGVLLLVGAGDLGGGQPIHRAGAVILILGSLSWAIGSVYSRRFELPESPMLAPAMQMLAGGALLFLVGLARGEVASVEITAVSLKSALSVVYLITFGSIVGFTAYVWLLRVSTPARVGTYAFVNPVVAVFVGCTIGEEPFTSRFLFSAAIIIGAVVLITTGRRRSVPGVDAVSVPAEPMTCDLEACPELSESKMVDEVQEERGQPLVLSE